MQKKKSADTIYFLSDTRKLYKGEEEYCNNIYYGETEPTDIVAPEGSIYIKTGGNVSIVYLYQNSNWNKLSFVAIENTFQNYLPVIPGSLNNVTYPDDIPDNSMCVKNAWYGTIPGLSFNKSGVYFAFNPDSGKFCTITQSQATQKYTGYNTSFLVDYPLDCMGFLNIRPDMAAIKNDKTHSIYYNGYGSTYYDEKYFINISDNTSDTSVNRRRYFYTMSNSGSVSADSKSSFGTATYPWADIYCTKLNETSDRKNKDNISDIENAESLILNLRPRTYTLKTGQSNSTRYHIGFIAQEVNTTIKENNLGNLSVVSAEVLPKYDGTEQDESKLGTYYDPSEPDENLTWSLSYSEIIAPLVKVVQNQQKQINELKTEIQLLKELNYSAK